MANETTALTPSSAASAPPIVMCDEPGCDQVATTAYRWDWGKTGNACDKHAAHYRQIMPNLKRTCVFTALASLPAPALTRDERTQLIAAKLSAEGELAEVQLRGAELYQQNTELTRDLMSLRVRHEECDLQLREARSMIAALENKLADREAQLGTATTENARLKTLIPKAAPKGKGAIETSGEEKK